MHPLTKTTSTKEVPVAPRWNPFTLRYVDRSIEAQYRKYELASNLVRNRIAMIVGFLITIAFLPIDFLWLSPPVEVSLFRFAVVLPLVGCAWWASYRLTEYLFPLVTFVATLALVSFPAALLIEGPGLALFAVMGALQCLLFINALVVLPFVYSFVGSTIGVVTMCYALLTVSAHDPQLVQYLVAVPAMAVLSLFVAHSRERTYRRLFVRREQVKELTARTNKLQREQIDWLRGLPANLESDMQTQLFSIEAELENLLERPDAPDAVIRAHAQLRTLMAMFETARFASAMGGELPEVQAVNLSRLLQDVVLSRSRYLVDDLPVKLDTVDDVWVSADEPCLRQAIEQIFNGAGLRLANDQVIDVSLKVQAPSALLTFSVDHELGDLVSSTLSHLPNSLGLSLYLANRIFVVCGGELDIRAADELTVFRVTMPLASAPVTGGGNRSSSDSQEIECVGPGDGLPLG